jgi:hypothetical protein
MNKLIKVLLIAGSLLLVSCSPLSWIPSFGGSSGTNVAANTQLGKTNNQTIGNSKSTDQTLKVEAISGDVKQSNDENKVNTEKVDSITINEIDPWILLLLVLGWLLPSPQEIWGGFLRMIRVIRGKE